METQSWQNLTYSNTNSCWAPLASNKFSASFELQEPDMGWPSWGQIPEHLPSCGHSCVIVPLRASWPIDSPHILHLLFWPLCCVCFVVSRKTCFLVHFVLPCVRPRQWHVFIVIQILDQPGWTWILNLGFQVPTLTDTNRIPVVWKCTLYIILYSATFMWQLWIMALMQCNKVHLHKYCTKI